MILARPCVQRSEEGDRDYADQQGVEQKRSRQWSGSQKQHLNPWDSRYSRLRLVPGLAGAPAESGPYFARADALDPNGYIMNARSACIMSRPAITPPPNPGSSARCA